MLPYHFESAVEVSAAADAVFSHLDDHGRLSAHMSNSSWMMAGSRMAIELDASEGRAVGAIIRLRGRVLGIPLCVEEIVTERNPPLRKVWETIGAPKLLVISQYRMGFEITPRVHSSQLRVLSTIPCQIARFHGGSVARSAISMHAGARSIWLRTLQYTSGELHSR